jgi:hypothetical protein
MRHAAKGVMRVVKGDRLQRGAVLQSCRGKAKEFLEPNKKDVGVVDIYIRQDQSGIGCATGRIAVQSAGERCLINERRVHNCNAVQEASEQPLQRTQDWTVLVRWGERREAVKTGLACVAVTGMRAELAYVCK